MAAPHPRVVRFGDFEVNLATRTLRERGRRVRLQGQPFQVLAALLAKPNEIVTREELIEKLWPDKGYGEFDLGLNTAVRKVRQALGESATEPKWIETIPKIGYRFVLIPESNPLPAGAETAAIGRKRPYSAYAVLSLAVVAAALAALFGDMVLMSVEAEMARLVIRPLTTYPGYESHPALSPDGTRVAFVWNGENRDNDDVYVRLIEDGSLTRVTDDPASERFPTWSPDGRRLGFLRPNATGAAVVVTPFPGPKSERVLTQLSIGGVGRNYGMDWSPDGRFLAVQDMETSAGRRGIFLVSASTGEKRRITTPPAAYVEDRWPSFSPDGRSLAFARGRTTHAIHAVKLDEAGWRVSEEARLTEESFFVIGVDWAPDGESVIFGGVTTGGRMELHRVDAESNAVSPLFDGVGAEFPSVVRRESDLALMVAFVRESNDNDLFLIPGPTARSEIDELPVPRKFVSSTRFEHSPRFSPDGERLVFVSHRSGGSELWIADRDGSNLARLTYFDARGGMAVESPRWSPDNQWIAFEAGLDGHEDLFLIKSSGGEPRRLTDEPSNEVRPSFSRDGRRLYFTSDKLGRPEIFRMPVEGGPPVRLTRNGGQDAFESPDGMWIYYAKRYGQFGDKGIYRMPVAGGEEERVLDEGRVGQWALSAGGIYLYRPADGDAPAALDFYPHDSLKPQTLVEFRKGLKFGTANALTVTPDDRSIVFVQNAEPSADLALAASR